MIGHVSEQLHQRIAEHSGQITGAVVSIFGASAVWISTVDMVLKIVASLLTIAVASLTLRSLLKKEEK